MNRCVNVLFPFLESLLRLRNEMMHIVLALLTIVSVGKTQSLDASLDRLSHPENLSINRIALVKLDIARDHTRNGNYPEGLVLLSEVVNMTADSMIVSKAFRVKAQILFEQGRFQEALEAIRLSKLRRPKDTDFYDAWVCNNLSALICTITGDYERGFKHFYQSLLLCEKNNRPQESGISSLNLGFAYYKVFDYRTAVKYFLRARGLPLYPKGQTLVLSNLALAYAHLDSTSQSLKCLDELFANKGALSKQDLMHAYYAYGITFQKLGLFDSAKYYFDHSMRVSEALKDDRFTSENSVSLATIYLHAGSLSLASDLLQNAERIANQNSYQDVLLRVHEQKICFSSLAKNFKDQVISQKEYIAQKQGLYNPQLVQIVARAKASFYEREYQAAIRHHYELLWHNDEQTQNMEQLGYMEVLILFLTTAMQVLLVVSFNIRKKNARRLEETVRGRSDSCKRKLDEFSDVIEKSRSAMVEWRACIETADFQLQKREYFLLK